MSNVLNYTEQGGAKTVIGGEIEINGTLTISEGSTVTGVVTADVVNNLTTTAAGKALDARQGKTLKEAVDGKYTAADATTATAGLVKQAANVAEAAGDAPTAAEFKALLDALIASGAMAAGA